MPLITAAGVNSPPLDIGCFYFIKDRKFGTYKSQKRNSRKCAYMIRYGRTKYAASCRCGFPKVTAIRETGESPVLYRSGECRRQYIWSDPVTGETREGGVLSQKFQLPNA